MTTSADRIALDEALAGGLPIRALALGVGLLALGLGLTLSAVVLSPHVIPAWGGAGLVAVGVMAGCAALWRTLRGLAKRAEAQAALAELFAFAAPNAWWVGGKSFERVRTPGASARGRVLEVLTSLHPEDAAAAWDAWAALVWEGEPFNLEVRLQVEGKDRWYRWSGRRASGTTLGDMLVGELVCVHDERVDEDEIEQMALLAVENPHPVFRIDMEGHLLIANEASKPLLASWGIEGGGSIPDALIGLLVTSIGGRDSLEIELACGDRQYGALFVFHKAGDYINVHCTDITERSRVNRALDESRLSLQELSDRMQHLAQHDALTGLPNRALFHDRLSVALLHSQRKQTLMGVMMIDLDRFKEINDTCGHDAGDALLVEVARRLSMSVRNSDTVARMGGDEFAIVLHDLAKEKNAIGIAEKILVAMGEPIAYEGMVLATSPSIGLVCSCGSEAASMADLCKWADVAMYEAKAAGRNTYRVFEPRMLD